jgi:hypothetical protein
MARLVVVACLLLAFAAPAAGQQRFLTVEATPTARTQLAIWIESEDGTRFATIRLTDAVAFRGIANRPGALQMNSGYHWPYGRREGVLPLWAHRRFEVEGTLFPRVVFDGRTSEGFASRSGGEEPMHQNTPDDYYCLSFTGGETLDAMSCASVFNSNKGRYLTEADVASGYAEPWEDVGGGARMRALSLGSLYPPRGDLSCDTGCATFPDAMRFGVDRDRVMPELDAVTMATPARDVPFSITFDVPRTWADGEYVVFVEANTEGDHAPSWDESRFPTPTEPSAQWDIFAVGEGYPYRGQPSVLYRVPVHIGGGGGVFTTESPDGYGELEGLDGELRSMDGTIVDDPVVHPGSGADRLRADGDGTRVRVTVPDMNPCAGPMPPEDCGRECSPMHPCAAPLLCDADSVCVGRCEIPSAPALPSALTAGPVEDVRHGHQWAHFTFVVPDSGRPIASYEVRVGTSPIVDEASFAEARPAKAATLDDEALVVPLGDPAGATIAVDIGGLSPLTDYYVAVRAFDDCHMPGPIASVGFETTAIHFTTVSPCFVATAAYGTPLDQRIGVLRRFRDRHLMTNALGRALVAAYYELGPSAAAWIAEDEDRRSAARGVLDPIVEVVGALTE